MKDSDCGFGATGIFSMQGESGWIEAGSRHLVQFFQKQF